MLKVYVHLGTDVLILRPPTYSECLRR
jgi:hypothetical protein